jgi:acyl-CoA thioesterase FadM
MYDYREGKKTPIPQEIRQRIESLEKGMSYMSP